MSLHTHNRSKTRMLCKLLLFFFFFAQGVLPATAGTENIFIPWDGTNSGAGMLGDGSEANPFIISTAKQFRFFTLVNRNNYYPQYTGMHYKLSGDIDLNWRPWTPIGYSTGEFKGMLDGNGFAVKHLSIRGLPTGEVATGLFGTVKGGKIKNLTVRGVSIDVTGSGNLSYTAVGGIAGSVFGGGEITDCYVLDLDVKVEGESPYVGGIAGIIDGVVGTIGGSRSSGVIRVSDLSNTWADVHAGGIAGMGGSGLVFSGNASTCDIFAENSNSYVFAGGLFGLAGGTVVRSYAKGNVTAEATGSGWISFAGGIAGTNEAGIQDSFSMGNIDSISPGQAYAGGIVGDTGAWDPCVLKLVHATGDIQAKTTDATDSAVTKAGGIAGRTDGDTAIWGAYSAGSVCADAKATWKGQNHGANTAAGGIVGHALGDISESYAFGKIDGRENLRVFLGGIVGYAHQQNNDVDITNTFWRTDAGHGAGLKEEIEGWYHVGNPVIRENNRSMDVSGFANQANFADAPQNWDFSNGGNWCYTDLDNRAKPHHRMLFADDGGAVLNTIAPDLVWIGPPAINVASGDREQLRLVAGEYMPDSGSMRFSGMPGGLGVKLHQDPGNPEIIVVTVRDLVVPWEGTVYVDYAVKGKAQAQKSFYLRAYGGEHSALLQTEIDNLNPQITPEGSTVSILDQTQLQAGQGTVIEWIRSGDAQFTRVAKGDLETTNGLEAPLPGYMARVVSSDLVDGNVLALSFRMDLSRIGVFEKWGQMTDAQRLQRLKDDSSLICFASADKMIGSGGILTWDEACSAQIVTFSNSGIVFHYIMTDEIGSIARESAVMRIPDQQADGVYEGGPIYFLTKNDTYVDDTPGPGPGTPEFVVEGPGEPFACGDGEVTVHCPVWGKDCNGASTVPSDVQVLPPDNWHECGLDYLVEDGRIVIYGQPTASGTYKLTVSGIVDGERLSTGLVVQITGTGLLHVTVVSINKDDWRGAVVSRTDDDEGCRVRFQTRWRAGVSIDYRNHEKDVRVYLTGLESPSARIMDADGLLWEDAETVMVKETAGRGAAGFEEEHVRYLVIEGVVRSPDAYSVSIHAIAFTDESGRTYRQDFVPSVSLRPGGASGGTGTDSTVVKNHGGGGCVNGSYSFGLLLTAVGVLLRRLKNTAEKSN